MKKSVITFSTICFIAAFMISCGKSACDCQKQAMELMQEVASNPMDMSVLEKSKNLEKECSKYTAEDFAACN